MLKTKIIYADRIYEKIKREVRKRVDLHENMGRIAKGQ